MEIVYMRKKVHNNFVRYRHHNFSYAHTHTLTYMHVLQTALSVKHPYILRDNLIKIMKTN
jgi:hypothetical protein